eukprot:gene7825-10629_t
MGIKERLAQLIQQSRAAFKPFLSSVSEKEMNDLHRAAMFHKCHNICKTQGISKPTEEQVHNFFKEVDSLNAKKLKMFVNDEITRQMTELFKNLAKCPNENSLANQTKKHSYTNNISASDNYCKTLVDTVGFACEIRKSNIPSAGDGVFIITKNNQDIMPGTLLCLYPGLVHLREHFKDEKYGLSLLPDDDLMIMSRADDSLIDGRTTLNVTYNPYAVGHKINHGTNYEHETINVMQLSYDFRYNLIGNDSFPEELRESIPNSYAKRPSFGGQIELYGVIMKSVVFIASRYIRSGDELLMDYRLNPKNVEHHPKWYRFSLNTDIK